MQLDQDSPCMEILVDLKNERTLTLAELLPDWWGRRSFH
jgi:hypothetical protein